MSLKGLAFYCEGRGLCGDEGVSDPMAIGIGKVREWPDFSVRYERAK